jgi:2-polyprenyl-3-methyl-5-hydroxy-6-metoxy-1,4-benzoquinol methylase
MGADRDIVRAVQRGADSDVHAAPSPGAHDVGAAPRCAGCGEALALDRFHFREVPSDPDPRVTYGILRCGRCGTGTTWPAPDPAALDRLYRDYAAEPPTPEALAGADLLVRWRRAWGFRRARLFFAPQDGARRLMRQLACSFLVPRATLMPIFTDLRADRAAARPLRLLDVGCGAGEFLEFATAAGVDAVGLEVGEGSEAAGRRAGLDIRTCRIESMVGREQFDLVRYCHVLEHLPDPAGSLRSARELLGAGGYLLVAVPRLPSAVTALLGRHAHLHVPYHLTHFSGRGLRLLVERAGFRVLAAKSKSNSSLCFGLAQRAGRPGRVGSAAWRMGCVLAEMVFDAAGVGDSIELHALAL